MLRRPLNILIRRLQASKALQSCVVAPANQKSLNDILSSYMRGATALRRPATRYTEFYGWTGSAFLFLFQLLSLLAKVLGESNTMRIAQVAPLYESVPPRLYGGTERVVSWLTEQLVQMGHDVTLFASGDSITTARLIAPCKQALRLNAECV